MNAPFAREIKNSDACTLFWLLSQKPVDKTASNQTAHQVASTASNPVHPLIARVETQPHEGELIMDDWMINPVSMFEEDVTKSKTNRSVA